MDNENPKVIFLDIDGVLNTHHHLRRQYIETGSTSNQNWSPIACKHISLLCRQFGARVVISSTWRYDKDIEKLGELFQSNDIDPSYLLDVTPSLIHREEKNIIRGDEIAHWLKENGYHPSASTLTSNSAYVIIDDFEEEHFLPEQLPRLVRVQQDKGFADKEAAVRAAEILNDG